MMIRDIRYKVIQKSIYNTEFLKYFSIEIPLPSLIQREILITNPFIQSRSHWVNIRNTTQYYSLHHIT